MFTEPELVVRRTGHAFSYADGRGTLLGDAVFQQDRDRQHDYSSSCTIRDASHAVLLIGWRLRHSDPVISHFVLCDEDGTTVASVKVLKSHTMNCAVTVDGEELGELTSRRTARTFVIRDVGGEEIARIKSASFSAGRRYRMTRGGPLAPLWQRVTTFLLLMTVLYPPPPLGMRTPVATFPV